jgi:hypothetical protein
MCSVLTASASLLACVASHVAPTWASSVAVSARSHSNLLRIAEHRPALIACSLDVGRRTSAASISSLLNVICSERGMRELGSDSAVRKKTQKQNLEFMTRFSSGWL